MSYFPCHPISFSSPDRCLEHACHLGVKKFMQVIFPSTKRDRTKAQEKKWTKARATQSGGKEGDDDDDDDDDDEEEDSDADDSDDGWGPGKAEDPAPEDAEIDQETDFDAADVLSKLLALVNQVSSIFISILSPSYL
jgi:hypothetical protein